MSQEGNSIYQIFSGHGVQMYRSIEMYNSEKYLYDNDVTFSEKGQNVKIYRSEKLLSQLWHLFELNINILVISLQGIPLHFAIPYFLHPQRIPQSS